MSRESVEIIQMMKSFREERSKEMAEKISFEKEYGFTPDYEYEIRKVSHTPEEQEAIAKMAIARLKYELGEDY